MPADYADTDKHVEISEETSVPETRTSLSQTGIEAMQGPPDTPEDRLPEESEVTEPEESESETPEPIEGTQDEMPDQGEASEERMTVVPGEPGTAEVSEQQEEPESGQEPRVEVPDKAEPIEAPLEEVPQEIEPPQSPPDEVSEAEGSVEPQPDLTPEEGASIEEYLEEASDGLGPIKDTGDDTQDEPGSAEVSLEPVFEGGKSEEEPSGLSAEPPKPVEEGKVEMPIMAEPVETSPDEIPADGEASMPPTEPPSDASEHQIIGTPAEDAKYWHFQSHDNTCAIVAQEGVLNKLTGGGFTEDALRNEAYANGWTGPGGTPIADVGRHWEELGFPVTHVKDADLNTLRAELEQGHAPIACVDAGHLWQDPWSLGEGHAVWVTGVEVNQAGNVIGVFVNDSGKPDDGGDRVDAAVFESAWSPLYHSLVTTHIAAPPSSTAGGHDVNQS